MRKLFLPFLLLLIIQIHALTPLQEAEDRRDVQAPALQSALHSEDKTLRQQAARALGRIQKPEGISPLLELLKDPSLTVQKEAAFSLGQYGWKPAFADQRENEIAIRLSEHLNTANSQLREILAEALGKVALTKAPTYLVPLLKDKNIRVRTAAVAGLFRYRYILKLRTPNTDIPLLEESEIQTLLNCANTADLELPRAVAYYFLRVQDPRGIPTLLKLSSSADVWTKFYVISALRKYDRRPATEKILLLATEDANSSVRTAAVQSVAALKFSQLLSPALRGDPSYHVRVAYVEALGTLAGTEFAAMSRERLEELYTDSQLSVQVAALRGLATFRDEGSRTLVRNALKHSNPLVRVAAVQCISQLENNSQADLLTQAGEDPDTRVKVVALEAVALQPETYAYTLIQKALASEELSVRGTAVTALSERKENERYTDAHTVYLNSLNEKWVELREEITKLWAAENTATTTLFLREAVTDPAASVAQVAATALKEREVFDFPTPNAVETLSFSPYRELKFERNPKVFLETTKGTLILELFYEAAPIHVANMIGFASDGKYNGLPIHRVVSNFVVQGGDPDKSGWGSAGYSLRAEINHEIFSRGSLGMPRSTGFDTGGVQFFINHVPTPNLDGQYTVFGRVSEGFEVVDQLEVGDIILHSWVEH